MDEKKKRLLKRIGEYVSPDQEVLQKVIAQQEKMPLFKLNAGESIGEMGYFSDGIRLASVGRWWIRSCSK